MRNLKKFLALVLAMAMAFSLMLSASAATVKYDDYTDKENVSKQFVEAVSVLTGLKVVQGDGEEGNKTFRPKDEITRGEAAAMVYRIATGDIEGTQERLYSDYGKFDDVKPGDWFAGYVGYCQNAGIIKGKTASMFYPYDKVTGYEVLAMILRAVGYGKNNEFTGSQWQVNVASLGKTKHITDSVVSSDFAYTLNMNATREIVAELLFRGSLIPQVTWTQIGGYNERKTLLGLDGDGNPDYNDYLAWEVFRLYRYGWEYGAWGRPQLLWKASLNPTTTTPRTVATLKADPVKTFTDLKRECDVAEMLEFAPAENSRLYTLFVDSNTAVTSTYKIVATDTVTKVGGYGRITEIYEQDAMDEQYPFHYWRSYWSTTDGNTALDDTIVMIDTYLAKVVSTAKPVLDTAGHVITPARMIVELYDGAQLNQCTRRTIQKPDGSKDEWAYNAGDVISLKGRSGETGASGNEAWAFTLPTVGQGDAVSNVSNARVLKQDKHVFDITKLEGTPGKQTTVYWNNGKHQVDNDDKTDALALRMDKAGNNINTTYTWYYDVKDNGETYLLGIDDGGKVNFGVITSVYVAYGADQTTDGIGQAVATVKYADGTTGTETIDYFLMNIADGSGPVVTTRAVGGQMTASKNTIQMFPVYNVGSKEPMEDDVGTVYDNTAYANANGPANYKGVVFMAPVTSSNAVGAAKNSYADNDRLGILNDNLFKFVKVAGDKTAAIEVAGGGGTYTIVSTNQNDYVGNWNATSTKTTNEGGKLYKNLAYITKTDGAATNANIVAWLDNETRIMVRNPSNGAINCYTLETLPGNVALTTLTVAGTPADAEARKMNEIDWADTDRDGRAEYVYVTGVIEGVTTYGLFYTNDLTASWDGTKAVMHGFWNGEETDLTFNSLELFNAVKNAYSNGSDRYNGHLFAIKQIYGVVEDVLGKNDSGFAEELLYDVGNGNTSGETFALYSGAAKKIVDSTTTIDWFFGNEPNYIGSNPYTQTTEAVYWTDDALTPVVYNASYNHYNGDLQGATVTVTDNRPGAAITTYTYHLNPNSKVYGIGSNVVLAEGVTALEYLNHSYTNQVTIVYENNNTAAADNAVMSVLEMYIQTDPNITPSNPSGPSLPSTPGIYVPAGDLVRVFTGFTGVNNTTLDTAIKGLGNGKVAYCSTATTRADVPVTMAPDQLYFPYAHNSSATVGKAAVLTIYNDKNVTVHSETGSAHNDWNGHAFMIDFRNAKDASHNVDATFATGMGVGTYRFEIVCSGITLSSGTFQIVESGT